MTLVATGLPAAGAMSAAVMVADDPTALSLVLGEVGRRLGARREPTGGSRAEWAAVVSACQSLVNRATAIQDDAIARLSAIEEEWLEDGTTVETRRALGHVALDAPDLVAGALGVTHAHAQRRVGQAVRLVGDGDGEGWAVEGSGDESPEGDDGSLGSGAVGLASLHRLMREGVLDAYRAGVVVEELAEAPVEVAEAVVAVLVPHVGVETAVQLRRRCRVALSRISPDLLRRRATRARESSGLRRWVQEPGVDRWEGTFPSEQAAEGWAAVDGLARRYVDEGRCDRVESARAMALMDLVRGQATIDVQLVVTVPATVAPRAAGPEVAVPTAVVPEVGVAPVVVPEVGVPVSGSRLVGAQPSLPTSLCRTRTAADDDGAPAPHSEAEKARRESSHGVADGWPLTVGDEACGIEDGDDLLEVCGPFPGEPVLVGRAWLRQLLADCGSGRGRPPPGKRRRRRVETRVEPCDSTTGALLGSDLPKTSVYRPGRKLAALVRARDGRCRFPGCSVAARFCDLDHVRPWPTGPTSAANLLCLCRRHHRIKQRRGWGVVLRADGRAVWTDPTGRARTSSPRDLLHAIVLPRSAEQAHPDADLGHRGRPTAGRPEAVDAESTVETHLGVLAEHACPPGATGSSDRGLSPSTTQASPRLRLVRPDSRRPLRYGHDSTRRPHHARHRAWARRQAPDAGGTGPPGPPPQAAPPF